MADTNNPNTPMQPVTGVTPAAPAQPAQPGQPTTQPAPAGTMTNLTSQPVQQDRAKEQETLKKLASKVEGKDYFEQQEEFAKTFEEREGEDSFRRAARIERERELAASKGDPLRDPVAKQQRMDMTIPQPGAVEDAQKIKDVGAESVKK